MKSLSLVGAVIALLSVAVPCAKAFDAMEAQRELFAGRYYNSVRLYGELTQQEPGNGDAWYGLVRSHLELRHARDAFAAAEQALMKAPQTAGAQAAAGLAAYRHGELQKAEAYFRTALKINPKDPGGLRGLANVLSTVSMFKSARDLRLKAFEQSPDDPELMLVHANTLTGKAHIEALREALMRLDPESEQARNLRVHIANDEAVGDRRLRRLVSPYENGQIRLTRILDGPSHPRGVGLVLQLNQKQNVKLLLDTGATGIAIAPKAAEKAGLQVLGGESSEAKGIGDQKAQASLGYLASEIKAGPVVFADYPVSVFRGAQTSDFDGLIGADVFSRFVITIDFVQLSLSLTTREQERTASDEPVDFTGTPTPGFYRVFRFGDHLAIPAFVNGGAASLFLIDSGSTSNLIDSDLAKQTTSVNNDSRITVKGIQGKVNEASRAGHISLVFAGFRQDNPDMIAINLEKMGDSFGVAFGGLLGMPVVGHFALTIDYREGTVKFDRKI